MTSLYSPFRYFDFWYSAELANAPRPLAITIKLISMPALGCVQELDVLARTCRYEFDTQAA